MSTPEEIARERGKLVELSERTRLALGQVEAMRARQVQMLQEGLGRITETNADPSMRMLEEYAVAKNPDYDPRAVERTVGAYIERMTGELDAAQRSLEATWLGIQESIIALDETGEVPSPRSPDDPPLLTDLPPRPGPDDEM